MDAIEQATALTVAITAFLSALAAMVAAIISLMRANLCIKWMRSIDRNQKQIPGQVVQAIKDSPEMGPPGTIDPSKSGKIPRLPDRPQ